MDRNFLWNYNCIWTDSNVAMARYLAFIMNMFKKDPLQIIPFRSYGTPNHLYVKGRAIEDKGIDLTKTGFFSLLRNSWKRFETDKVKNAKLTLSLPDGRNIKTNTDSQGYFLIDEMVNNLLPLTDKESWLHYFISFDNKVGRRKFQENNKFKGEILIPF